MTSKFKVFFFNTTECNCFINMVFLKLHLFTHHFYETATFEYHLEYTYYCSFFSFIYLFKRNSTSLSKIAN